MRTLIFFVCLLLAGSAFAQGVKIGFNTPVDANSLLELESANKGLLLPRITDSAMKAMQHPAAGLMIFNTTDSVIKIRRDSSWVTLTVGATPSFYTFGGWIGNVAASSTYTMLPGYKVLFIRSPKRVTGVATAILGNTSNAASEFSYHLCYKAVGGVVTPFDNNSLTTFSAYDHLNTSYSANGSIILQPGIYQVGMGVKVASLIGLNRNDNSTGWLMVTDPE